METKTPAIGAVLVAVLFALSCFATTVFVWRSFGGPTPLAPKGYNFHVSFDQAATLTPNAQVRIAGVPVGKVLKVTPRGLRTDAVLQLDRQYAPIPSDARVILRTKTLLGEAFIELTPGSRTAPKLPEGGRLPISQVGETQQLDQVLSAFDKPTRTAFKRFLLDISSSLNGRGEDLSAGVGNLAPATNDLGTMLLILDRQQDSVTRLVRDGGRILRSVGNRQADVQTLVTAGQQVFDATAARNTDLTAVVRALPPFLTELRASLRAADRAAVEAAPTLRALRPVAPLVRPGLEQTAKLAPQLEGLFRAARPVQISAGTGLPAFVRIVKSAGPLMGQIYPAARELVPVVDLLGRSSRDIVASFANVGAATQASTPSPDGPQHYLRTIIPLVNEGFYGFSKREPSNRHNPYMKPGGLDDLTRGGLRAWDCRNLSNPATFPPPPPSTGPPPCLVQAPWKFRGATRSFPHLELAAP